MVLPLSVRLIWTKKGNVVKKIAQRLLVQSNIVAFFSWHPCPILAKMLGDLGPVPTLNRHTVNSIGAAEATILHPLLVRPL